MSLSKNGDEYNKETSVIAKLLNEANAFLYIDRQDSSSAVDSRVALDSFQRIAPNWQTEH